MAQWFHVKIARLNGTSDVEEKKNILSEIKIKLGSLSGAETAQVSRSLDLKCLFSELTSTDREYIEQICEVLKSLFDACEPGEILQKYSTDVSGLMSHPNAITKTLISHYILNAVSDPRTLPSVLTDIDSLVAVVKLIADEDLMIAKSAMNVAKKIGENPEGCRILYSGLLLRTFAKLLAKNDIVTFRVYEVITDIATFSKEGLETSANSGFLDSLVSVLENDDVLLQLNALEVITRLTLTEDGLNYLEQKDVLQKLVRKIASADENPLSNLLVPGLMKFFGNVARLWPDEIFSKYPIVISSLFEVLEEDDQTILGVALDTLGQVAFSVQGKYGLQSLGDSMFRAMKRIAEVIRQMPSDLRLRALENLAIVLDVKKPEHDNKILSLTKLWFDSLCDDPLSMIVGLCRQPFSDIRKASLDILAVIALQPWGQEYMSTFPGLVEFLLDRSIEAFKECKEAKYEVILRLSEAERDIFNADTMQKFKKFVQEGPLFVDTSMEVAIEGSS